MLKVVGDVAVEDEVNGRSLLDEIAREGARRMPVVALETEVAAYLEAHRDEPNEDGHALVVRNGKGPHPEGDGRLRDDPGERASGERPANGPRRRAATVHEPHPAAVHAPFPEGRRGVARALSARAVYGRLPRGARDAARG